LARPRSEDKRKAILEAALEVFAERGIANAPTAAISRAAGVAEGTLFTYFKSKNDLMDELYLELRKEFSVALTHSPRNGDLEGWLRTTWDRFLHVGAEHPEWLKVQAQLRASGRLFKEGEPPQPAILEVLHAAQQAAGGELRGLSAEYLVLALRAQAEATIEYIRAHPQEAEVCRELGFRMLWRGLTGCEASRGASSA
jgi:AcrR family transcriptional regulator